MSFDKRKALQNALLYTQQGKWDRAIAEYQAILKADPSDLTVCNNLGDLFARAGRVAEAIEQYRKLGESYRTDGLSVKAIAVYKKIAKLDPAWTEAYTACGDLYLEQGLVGEAKLQFATAAQLYSKAGETAKVVEVYQRLAQLDPANLSLLTKLADLVAKQGSPEAAAAEYERAAQAAEAAGQAADAKRLLKKARELAPGARPTVAGAEKLLAEGKAAAACDILVRLAAEAPEAPGGWRLLAEAQAAQERPEDALAALEQGIKHGLPEGEVADLLGRLFQALGRTEDATALCDRLVEDALARGEPGEAVGRCTSLIAAAPSCLPIRRRLVDLLEALGRDADLAEARRALAEAAEAAGQTDVAVAAYRALLARDPSDETAQARLSALAPEPVAEAARDLGEFALLLEEPGLIEEPVAAPPGDATVEPSPEPLEAPELLGLAETEAAESEEPSLPALAAEEETAPAAAEDELLGLAALSLEAGPALAEPAAPSPELGLAPEEPVGPPETVADVAPSGLLLVEEPPAPGPAEPAALAEPSSADFTLSGEGSLDFLGGSVGLGGLALDEDDAPSGQAAEQLAEAEVYLKYGLEDKARGRLLDVIRLSPNSVTVRRKLKNLYREQHQVEQACDQIVAIAKILEERQKHDAAREEILEGLELAPDHAELRRLLEGPSAEAPALAGATVPEPSPEPGLLEVERVLELETRAQAAEPPRAAAATPGADAQPAVEGQALPLELELPGVTEEAARAPEPPEELLSLLEVTETVAQPGPADAAAGVRLPGEELPPELRALLAAPEEEPLVVEAVPARGEGGLADDLAEAEFYLGQGMEEEAREVARRLQARFPDHPAVAALLARLESPPPSPGSFGSLMFAEQRGAGEAEQAVPLSALAAGARPATPEPETETAAPPTLTVREGAEPTGEFVDLRAELEQELPPEAPRSEAALVNGLLAELKRGVREQVDAKDFETHYNLGIAYKEMDLYDEAIQEFRLASGDPKRVVECADLLGQCHLAKGQPQLAVTELRAGLGTPGHPPEAYRSLRYGLALAYEALGEEAAALEQLEQLEREDPRFRDVQGRLQSLRARLPRQVKVEPAPPAAEPPRQGKRRKISFI